jgi:hypothetical protein
MVVGVAGEDRDPAVGTRLSHAEPIRVVHAVSVDRRGRGEDRLAGAGRVVRSEELEEDLAGGREPVAQPGGVVDLEASGPHPARPGGHVGRQPLRRPRDGGLSPPFDSAAPRRTNTCIQNLAPPVSWNHMPSTSRSPSSVIPRAREQARLCTEPPSRIFKTNASRTITGRGPPAVWQPRRSPPSNAFVRTRRWSTCSYPTSTGSRLQAAYTRPMAACGSC